MASAFPESLAKALPDGKNYHCNLIYNYASRSGLKTDDTRLALKFVKFLVEKLTFWGYSKCYYYDQNAKPGEDVFRQNLDPASISMLTLVIITERFEENEWIHYIEKTVLKTKIDEKKDNRSEVIPIALGKESVPQELAASIALWFDVDESKWQYQKQELESLKRAFDGKVPATGTERGTYSQDPGDGRLLSNVDHMIVNPMPSMQGDSNITQNRNESPMESLSTSVAAMNVSSTLPLPPESLATSSQASQDHETSSSSSGTSKEVRKDKSPTEREDRKNDEDANQKKGHVMISYSWKQKAKALWIKTHLEKNGFPIWIDENNMGRKVLDSMADGVEKADVLLLCLSDSYKKSENCEREATYAGELNKIIIPLILEDFKRDEWLGILVTGNKYYKFSGNSPSVEEMKKLLQELAKYYKKDLKEPVIIPFNIE